MLVVTKACPGCSRDLPIEEYGIDRSKASGRFRLCKPCASEKSLAYYYANRERVLERMRRRPRPHRVGKRYWRPVAERSCDDCRETYTPADARQQLCPGCSRVRRQRHDAEQAARRKRERHIRALLRAAKALADWAPPVMLPALPRPTVPARPPRPERPLLRFTGGGGAYRAALKLDPCAYCGEPGGQRDHIVPRKVAGGDTGTTASVQELDNLTGACAACNAEKRDQDLLGFLLARA